jgi:hypothetical protein
MDERPDAYSDTYDTHIGRVRPMMEGRALALPPVAPLIGAFGLFFGFALGFGLAPTAAPASTPGPTTITAASPSTFADPSASPGRGVVAADSTFELPPTDGLSLAKALEALDSTSMMRVARSPYEIVSARVARWAEVWSSPAAPPDVWVWAIAVRSASPLWCRGEPGSESAGPSRSQTPISCPGPTTEMFVLDYHTGDFLEAMSPAWP